MVTYINKGKSKYFLYKIIKHSDYPIVKKELNKIKKKKKKYLLTTNNGIYFIWIKNYYTNRGY